jgi:hypothetical protein
MEDAVSGDPFHWMVESDPKLVPLTVKVNAGPPAVPEFGLSEVIAGGGLMVNGALLEVMPVNTTVTVALP